MFLVLKKVKSTFCIVITKHNMQKLPYILRFLGLSPLYGTNIPPTYKSR